MVNFSVFSTQNITSPGSGNPYGSLDNDYNDKFCQMINGSALIIDEWSVNAYNRAQLNKSVVFTTSGVTVIGDTIRLSVIMLLGGDDIEDKSSK